MSLGKSTDSDSFLHLYLHHYPMEQHRYTCVDARQIIKNWSTITKDLSDSVRLKQIRHLVGLDGLRTVEYTIPTQIHSNSCSNDQNLWNQTLESS